MESTTNNVLGMLGVCGGGVGELPSSSVQEVFRSGHLPRKRKQEELQEVVGHSDNESHASEDVQCSARQSLSEDDNESSSSIRHGGAATGEYSCWGPSWDGLCRDSFYDNLDNFSPLDAEDDSGSSPSWTGLLCSQLSSVPAFLPHSTLSNEPGEHSVHDSGTQGVDSVCSERVLGGKGGQDTERGFSNARSEARRWVFTCNNPTAQDIEKLGSIDVQYIVYQRERGASGTEHLQGLLCFAGKQRLSGLRKRLGPFHFEVMRGSLEQAEAYCTKEDTRVGDIGTSVYRRGSKPSGQGNRSDLDAIAVVIQSGASERAIFDNDPGAYIKWSSGIRRARELFQVKRTWKTEVYWCFGGTGTGKSRWCQEQAPDAYWKTAGDYWWCGYSGDADVIIDDYRCDFCKFSELLRLTDRFPLKVNIKGGSVQFVAKRLYISSPLPPVEMWEKRSEEDIQQLVRRLSRVIKFTGVGVIEDVATNYKTVRLAPVFMPMRK